MGNLIKKILVANSLIQFIIININDLYIEHNLDREPWTPWINRP